MNRIFGNRPVMPIMTKEKTGKSRHKTGTSRAKNRDRQGQNRESMDKTGTEGKNRDITGTIRDKIGTAGKKRDSRDKKGRAGTIQGQAGTKHGESWAKQGKQKSLPFPDGPCLIPAWFVSFFSLLTRPSLSLFCPCSFFAGFVTVRSLFFSETARDISFLSLSIPTCPSLSSSNCIILSYQ